jgi:creatinine amidohydrolase
MSDVRRWDELTREEIGELAPAALTVIPVGSTEQHGPHLAAGTDAVLATAVAEHGAAAAARPETILLAPTLAYGASDHHLPFGATLSLRVETFQQVLADLLASAARAGCRRVFILNGHGGNTAACAIAAAEASRVHGLLCASAIYSQLLEPGVVDAPLPGHAGQFETSLMLAVAPDRVRMERARSSPGGAARRRHRGLAIGEPGRWAELDGFTDLPETASAELGTELLALCARAAAEAFEEVADLHV